MNATISKRVPSKAHVAKALDRGSPSAPALNVTYRNPSGLAPNIDNPREHVPRQVQQIARSIEAFGFLVPILVDQNDGIVAGHGRLLAAQELGLTSVPVINIGHLNASQKAAFLIADNRLSEISTWDRKLLAQQLELLSSVDLDFDISTTGFEIEEIDVILQEAKEPDRDDSDDEPLPLRPAVSQVGDLWMLGPHRILCGDALDPNALDTLMQGDLAAVVVSDPPFNVRVSSISGLGKIQHREFPAASGEMTVKAFTEFLRNAFLQMIQHSCNGSLHYIFMDWKHVAELISAGAVYSELKNLCVWSKEAGGMGSLYRSRHELVFVFKAGTAPHQNHIQLGRYGRDRSNVWEYTSARSYAHFGPEADLLSQHPTPKPVALVADILLDASTRGEIILDTFLGSGTAVVAAERTGRVARGVELDPQYVDLSIRRWQRLTRRSAVHAGLQCTFDELAEARLEVAHA